MDVIEQFINNRAERADEYREMIEEMMVDFASYHYAEGTLLGILDYIDKNDNITDAQIQAVENIKAKPNEHYGRDHY